MEIFNGNFHAQKIEEIITHKISTLNEVPTLGILQIGDNPASEKFIELKINFCNKHRIPTEYLKLSENLTDSQIYTKSEEFFNKANIKGVIVQLPLPRPTLYKIISKIPLKKDIDALIYQSSLDNAVSPLGIKSPVIRAVEYFIDSNNIIISNKEICILGYGFLVGRPLAAKMLQLQGKVTVLDNLTQKIDFKTTNSTIQFLPSYKTGTPLNYQLVISSAGVPNLLKGQYLLPETSVIDFGSTVVNGKTVGDLDLNSSLDHLKFISPSPGGMGPLVVRFLILNLLEHTV